MILALAAAAALAVAAPPPSVHVSVIGDSVPSAMALDQTALSTLGQGIDLDLDAVACRRLDLPSCIPTGATAAPLNVVEMANSKLPLGPVVVIACGYNDKENLFPREVEDTLAALTADGVKRVLWLTLREARNPYVTMNDALFAAVPAHPELTVLDWNMYSRSHPDWFGDDGLHLVNPAGGEAMATFIHDWLTRLGIAGPPVAIVTARLRAGRNGAPYRVRLRALGGAAPRTWALAGALPRGMRLEPNGMLVGTPRTRGTYRIALVVRDGIGVSATRTLVLRIR